MKAKKGNKKAKAATAKKQAVAKKQVEKNQWGFRKDTASDRAITLIAGGKIGDARKEFGKNLSFGKLFKDLAKRGFTVKQSDNGQSSIVALKVRAARA